MYININVWRYLLSEFVWNRFALFFIILVSFFQAKNEKRHQKDCAKYVIGPMFVRHLYIIIKSIASLFFFFGLFSVILIRSFVSFLLLFSSLIIIICFSFFFHHQFYYAHKNSTQFSISNGHAINLSLLQDEFSLLGKKKKQSQMGWQTSILIVTVFFFFFFC